MELYQNQNDKPQKCTLTHWPSMYLAKKFLSLSFFFNSLIPSDALKHQQSSSISAEITACCLRASNHYLNTNNTGDPLHSRARAHSRAPLFTQPCPHCSHSRAPGEQWARLCVFTLQGCVQAARLCRGSPVNKIILEKAFLSYIQKSFPLSIWISLVHWGS